MLELYKTKRKLEWIKIFPDGREVLNTKTAAGRREYSYRTTLMFCRQLGNCAICGKWMSGMDATFDHAKGRGAKGAWRDDRIGTEDEPRNAAVHEHCNILKGSRKYHWIKDGDKLKYVPMSTGDEA